MPHVQVPTATGDTGQSTTDMFLDMFTKKGKFLSKLTSFDSEVKNCRIFVLTHCGIFAVRISNYSGLDYLKYGNEFQVGPVVHCTRCRDICNTAGAVLKNMVKIYMPYPRPETDEK